VIVEHGDTVEYILLELQRAKFAWKGVGVASHPCSFPLTGVLVVRMTKSLCTRLGLVHMTTYINLVKDVQE